MSTHHISPFQTLKHLLFWEKQLWKKDPHRWFGPLLLGLNVQLLLMFSWSQIPESFSKHLFVSSLFLVTFLTAHGHIQRQFYQEHQNGLFYMKALRIRSSIFLLSKIISTLQMSIFFLFPTFILNFLTWGYPFDLDTFPLLFLSLFLSLLSLVSCGILLALITLKAKAQHLLFSVLFYPLTVPVFLVSTQFCLALGEAEASAWLQLLGWLTFFYLILCYLLAQEFFPRDFEEQRSGKGDPSQAKKEDLRKI